MVKETHTMLGKKAVYTHGSLKFEVTVTDIKSAYGQIRYLITPASGSGEVWVFAEKVKPIK